MKALTLPTAVTALALSIVCAAAHDAPQGWAYPTECCSGTDCRMVSASWIAETPGGYVIATTGEVIPYGDARIRSSPDGLYHWCSHYGRDDTQTICLFVPQSMF